MPTYRILRRPCVDCGTENGTHGGRGLCRQCYRRHQDHGDLHTYPVSCPREIDIATEFVEDLNTLGLTAATNGHVAVRLGVTRRTVERRRAAARRLGLL